MVNSINLTMSNKGQIATWKANRRKLVSVIKTGYVIQHSCNLTGLLDCWNTRLHRSRNLFTTGLWKGMRLVVFGGDYVRVLNRLSTILLGIHAWHLPEDHAVGELSCLSRWCPFEHRGWGSHPAVSYSLQSVWVITYLTLALKADHYSRTKVECGSYQESPFFLWSWLGHYQGH
jgi:hypothetical protein